MAKPNKKKNEALGDVTTLEKVVELKQQEDPRFEQLNGRIDQVLDLITKVAEMIPKPITDSVGNIDTTIESKLPPDIQGSRLPIPSKWREKINQILGPEFEALVDESSGGNYTITIYIPPNLDRRGNNQPGRDFSTGLIRRASDIADVENWATRILQNIQKTHNNFKK